MESVEQGTTFVARLPDVRALLETDLRAAFDGDPAATFVDETLLCYPGVAAIIQHRLAHELQDLIEARLHRTDVLIHLEPEDRVRPGEILAGPKAGRAVGGPDGPEAVVRPG